MEPNWFLGFPLSLEAAAGRAPEGPSSSLFDLGPLPDRVRPYAIEDIHITLAFLGGCGEEAARAAWERAETIDFSPLTVTLGRVEVLGHPKKPTALAALLDEGREAVEAAIAAHRASVAEAAGRTPDLRPPKAHATWARIRRNASPLQRRKAIAWAEGLQLSKRGRLERLALFTWSHDRRTRLFRIVLERPL